MDMDRKLRNEIRMYRARVYLSEDAFHASTAIILDVLMKMDRLMWFHANQNIYRRGLTSLRCYLGRKYKAMLDKLARRLGAKGKRMGIKPGVPDMIIHSHRLTLELKKSGCRASTVQKKWMKDAERWGWNCFVCDGPEKVLEALVAEGILKPEDYE